MNSTITLKTSFFFLAFLLHFFPAKASIDGAPAQKVGWGTTKIPVQPGTHSIYVFFPYMFPKEAGKATTQVTVSPGQDLQVNYRAPMFVFSSGKLTF